MRQRRPLAVMAFMLVCAAGARGDEAKPPPPAPRRIEIAVTEKGFEPKGIKVKRGETVTLVFTRKTNHTCAKQVIVYLDDDKTVRRDLPLDKPVEITLTFPKAGELGYACAKMHYGGVIRVE